MDLETTDFDQYADMLAQVKHLAEPSVLGSAMEAARRYAAVDTNAIEGIYEVDRGFTRTVATQAAAWEAMMEARGPQARPAFDDAMNGYEYVLDAATGNAEINEKWVKDVHAIICASQQVYRVHTPAGPQDQPLPKGTYKTMPNSPTLLDGSEHSYAPVMDTAPEMQRLTGELRSDRFLDAHPILQAGIRALCVCVHSSVRRWQRPCSAIVEFGVSVPKSWCATHRVCRPAERVLRRAEGGRLRAANRLRAIYRNADG